LRIVDRFVLIGVSTIVLSGLMLLGDSSLMRALGGLLLMLFLPGYVLAAALFPARCSLGWLERFFLSFGLSITVVPLLGLLLNYLPWGINFYSVLVSLSAFILLFSAVACYRRNKLPERERFRIRWQFGPGGTRFNRLLTVALLGIVIGVCGSLYCLAVAHKDGEKFTEFYILGPGGAAEGYPHQLKPGEKGRVILGIVNHEQRPVAYNVKILMNGSLKGQKGPVQLAHGGKWEGEVVFSGQKTRGNIKVEFVLTRDGEKSPYRSLHLWMDGR
jgi:uncharacterized membrane protein